MLQLTATIRCDGDACYAAIEERFTDCRQAGRQDELPKFGA